MDLPRREIQDDNREEGFRATVVVIPFDTAKEWQTTNFERLKRWSLIIKEK
jgi:hypothetical protein